LILRSKGADSGCIVADCRDDLISAFNFDISPRVGPCGYVCDGYILTSSALGPVMSSDKSLVKIACTTAAEYATPNT
jgi:hypothetical protein